MKCLLILASLTLLAASSPYKGYEEDSGWRGVGQPVVYIPAILLRGALQPGVHIPLERQRTISMRYPSMTAGTMPGFVLLDYRAAVGDADMMDMEARKGGSGKVRSRPEEIPVKGSSPTFTPSGGSPKVDEEDKDKDFMQDVTNDAASQVLHNMFDDNEESRK